MNLTVLDLSQFQAALTAAKRRFAKIREKYPTLRAYLALSLRGDQTKLENSLIHFILESPSIWITT